MLLEIFPVSWGRASTAISLALRTTFAPPHTFCHVPCLFSFVSRCYLGFSFHGFDEHSLFSSMVFDGHALAVFSVLSLWLISNFIPRWREKIINRISIFLKLLRLFCDLTCDLSWGLFSVPLRRMCVQPLWDALFCMSSFRIMYHLWPVFPYWFSAWNICPSMQRGR